MGINYTVKRYMHVSKHNAATEAVMVMRESQLPKSLTDANRLERQTTLLSVLQSTGDDSKCFPFNYSLIKEHDPLCWSKAQ